MAFNFPRFTLPGSAVSITPGTDIQTIVNSNPAGTVFLLKAGTYRLQSIRPKTGMSFYGEVSSEGKLLTTLNGSKPITNFQLSLRKNALGTNLYVSTGQTQAAIQTGLKPDGTTRNQPGWERSSYVHDVFIGEKPLRHAANIQSVVPGTFYFDYANNQIFIADNPNGKIVEVSDKSEAFSSSADSVKIRNLRIEKYANGMQQGAISAKANWLIEGNEVRLTHGTGISLNSGSIVRRNYVHTNGAKGIGGGGGNNVLIEDNEVAFNNFAKFAYGYDTSGIKASGDNNTIRGNYVHDNDARGIWIDVGSKNILIEANLVKNNTYAGIVYEVSSKGVIRNNKVGGNGKLAPWFFSSQILIQNSRENSVYGNQTEVSQDYGHGINIVWQNRGTNEISVDNSIYNNQTTYLGSSGLSGASGPADIYARNKFLNNDYRFLASTSAERFSWNGEWPNLTLSEFQTLYGQEQGGSVSHSITPLTWNWQYSLPTDVPKLWRIEAEAIAQRTGFGLEVLGDASGGQALSLKGVPANQDGTATFQFNGVTGTYNLFLGSFDENDGAARFEVAKNGTSIGSITLDQLLGSATPEAQTRVRRQVGASFQLSKGDTLRIRGWQDKAEFARLDYVELVPNTSTQPSLQLNSVAGYSAPSAHLIGSESIDYLVGGIADNLLVGKMGNDVLTSGSNADQDIVLFSSITERQDIIKDFDRVDSPLLGDDDRDSIQIVLAGFAATGNAHHLQQGILSDDRLVKGTDDLGLAAGFRYFELSGNLYFDSNGGSFDSGTGSLALAMLANKPKFDSLSGSITII